MDPEERYQKLIAELSERDRQREAEKQRYKTELDAKFEEKMKTVRDIEIALDKEKMEYEVKMRKKFERSYQEDITQLERQKQWLKQYERELYDKFQQMVDQHKHQTELDAREATEKMRKQFEQTTAEESAKRDAFMRQQAIHEAELQATLDHLKDRFSAMDSDYKALQLELNNYKAKNLEISTVAQRREDELKDRYTKEINELKASLNNEINEREKTISSLKRNLIENEREVKLLQDKVRREAVHDLEFRYDQAQRDFEEKIIAETEAIRRTNEARMQEKEEELSKKEKQFMENLQKIKRKQEMEMTQRRDQLESELLAKYQQMQEELLERDRLRELEKIDYKRDLEHTYEKLQHQLTLEMQAGKNEFEHSIWTKNLEIKEGLKEVERQRETQATQYKVELYQKVEQKMEELAQKEFDLERYKAQYEQQVLEKFKAKQIESQKEMELQRQKMENYQVKLWEKFMALVEQHKQKIEQDAIANTEKIRQAVGLRAEEEVAKRESLLRIQANHEAEVESTLEDLRGQLRTMEEQHKALTAQIDELRAKNLRIVAEHQQRDDIVKLEHGKEVSDLRNQYVAQINEKESQIMVLHDQLGKKEREMETMLEQEKAEIEKRMHDKYDRIHKEFKDKFIRQITTAKNDEHKRLTDQEIIIHEQEAELLQRVNQMQEELLMKDREREKDKAKYKQELEKQYEVWRRKAEQELAEKKEDYEKDLLQKYQSLQEDILQRDRDRESEKEKFKSQVLQKLDQKEKALRDYESYMKSEKERYERQLRENYDKGKQEQEAEVDEFKKRLEVMEKELFEKYERMIAEEKKRLANELNERKAELRKDFTTLSTQKIELAKKYSEIDKDIADKRQQLQDEFQEKERHREMEKVKYKLELEQIHNAKLKDLKDQQDHLENEKLNFERKLLAKYQQFQENDAKVVKEQMVRIEEYLDKFQALLEEHKNRLDTEMRRKRDGLRRDLENQVADELDKTEKTQHQLEVYETEVESTLRHIKDELQYMEGRQKSLSEEIIALKTQNAQLRIDHQKDDTELQAQYLQTIRTLRKEMGDAVADRDNKIRELVDQIHLNERENVLWQQRTKMTVEEELRGKYEKMQKEFEQKLIEQTESAQFLKGEVLLSREQELRKQEEQLLEKSQKVRDEQEIEYTRKKVEIEKDLFAKHQKLQEELFERDKQRELDKLAHLKTLDQKFEAKLKELRDKEAKLEDEKARFERQLSERYERTKEYDEARMKEQQSLLEAREAELKQKINDLIEQHKQDSNRGTEDRSAKLLMEEQLKLEIEKRKQELEKEFFDRHKRLQNELLERDKSREEDKRLYKSELDQRYSRDLDELKQLQTNLEHEKADYEALLKEIFLQAQERATLKINRQREKIVAYERELYVNFKRIVESYEKQLETEFEERVDTLRRTLHTQASEEADRIARFMQEKSAYEAETQELLTNLRNQFQQLQLAHQNILQQVTVLSAEKLQLETELYKRLEEVSLTHQQELQELSIKMSSDLTEKSKHVMRLSEALAAKERETVIRIEKAKVDAENDVRIEYQKIQENFERNLLEQTAQTRTMHHEQQLKERTEFEKELRSYYEQILQDSEQRVLQDLTKLFTAHDLQIAEQRKKSEEQQREVIERILHNSVDSSKEQDEYRIKFVKAIKEQYENLLTEQKAKIEQLLQAQEENRLAHWTIEETKTQIQLTIEAQSQTKYEALLKHQKDQLVSHMRELEQKLRVEIDKRDALLVDQEKHFRSQTAEYEKHIRDKYTALIEEHQAQMKILQSSRTQEELKHMEHKMHLEEEKIKYIEETEKRLDEQAKEKYSKLVQSIEDHWRKEAEARELRIHARMKQHYETLLKAKQDHLDHCIKVNDDIDKTERDRWASALQELKDKQAATLTALEEKLKKKYDSILEEYEQQYKAQLEQHETNHLQKLSKNDNDKPFWDKRMRKLKIAFAKWKFDYQAYLQEKYEAMFNAMQSKYLKEFEDIAVQNTKLKEREGFGSLAIKEKEILLKEQEALRSTEAQHHLKVEKQKQLVALKTSIEKLWEALEVDQEERAHFLNQVHSSTHDAELVYQLYEKECTRLTDKLPLMQAVTRREFVKHRLESIHKYPSYEGNLEFKQLSEELKTLSDQLLLAIPEYQRRYGEQFTYRGKSYLEIMKKD